MITLRPYQEQAIAAVNKALQSGVQRTIMALPTGTGKTITGEVLAKRRGGRTLWTAHRDELIQQPVQALRAVNPDAIHGVVKAERNEVNARDIVFASIQTIQRDDRLGSLTRAGSFDLVVLDEAHHGTAPSYRKVLEAVGCFREDGPRLVGLTATPERADQQALDEVFETIAYQYHLAQAIADGYLVPPAFAYERIEVDFDDVGTRYGDFKPGELDVALMQAGIVKSIAGAVNTHCIGRRTLIFVISVEQAKRASEAINDLGIPAAWISGETQLETRRATLRRFAAGEYRALVNCAVLLEGYDDPGIDSIMVARPTKSKPLYVQMIGRGLRIHPGKTDCLIVDMVGVSKRHTLVQAPAIFGLAAEPGSPAERAAYEAMEGDEIKIDYWRQRLQTQVDGMKGRGRRALNWIRAKDGVYALPCGGYGTLVLREYSEGLYGAAVVGRQDGPDIEPLASEPVSLELAQGIAEDYVRRVGEMTLSSRGSRWRNQPATDKQIEALRKWKIDAPPGITKGLASDIMTATLAAKIEPATDRQLAALARLGVVHGGSLSKREAGRLIGEARAG
jgi:superfamily II DNA or RNA helicase